MNTLLSAPKWKSPGKPSASALRLDLNRLRKMEVPWLPLMVQIHATIEKAYYKESEAVDASEAPPPDPPVLWAARRRISKKICTECQDTNKHASNNMTTWTIVLLRVSLRLLVHK